MAEKIVIDLFEEMGKFIDGSSIAPPGADPLFVLLMGGVGAGKTTIRKQSIPADMSCLMQARYS